MRLKKKIYTKKMNNIEKRRRNKHITLEIKSLPALFVIVQSVKDITKNITNKEASKKYRKKMKKININFWE